MIASIEAMKEAERPTPGQAAEAVLLDERHRGRLLGYARSRFGIAAADAEDLLQDTALGLLRQRGFVERAEGFVFAAFRARCLRFVEAARAQRSRYAEGDEGDIPAAGDADRCDRTIALREALTAISSGCRRLLAAHYVEGLSLSEAATQFATPYAAVSKRVSRCLKRLRACLI
jgi:RNA polymerase sigma factor (sigma-70 family)